MKIRPLTRYRGSILILDLSGPMVSLVRLDDAYCVHHWQELPDKSYTLPMKMQTQGTQIHFRWRRRRTC